MRSVLVAHERGGGREGEAARRDRAEEADPCEWTPCEPRARGEEEWAPRRRGCRAPRRELRRGAAVRSAAASGVAEMIESSDGNGAAWSLLHHGVRAAGHGGEDETQRRETRRAESLHKLSVNRPKLSAD